MDAARFEPDNSPDAPSTEGLTQELARELAAVAAAAGCELTRAEFKGGQLRLFVDKPEGVTIDDCQRVSKQASAILDVLDFGSGKYVLEVSSPGLDRPLYRPRDYARFVGSLARVRWQEAGVSHPRTDVGRIEAFDETDAGTITLRNETGKSVLSIRLDQIESARLEPEF